MVAVIFSLTVYLQTLQKYLHTVKIKIEKKQRIDAINEAKKIKSNKVERAITV